MKLKESLFDNKDAFIQDNKKFIYAVANKICKKILHWENDDELSIALIAFNNACDTYKEDKGNFFSYAKVLIKNSLIDYFRKSSNNPYLTFETEDNDLEYIDSKNSMNRYQLEQENLRRCEEIKLFSTELKEYNLSFDILAKSCPSHKDTKDKLLNLAFTICKESSMVDYIRNYKMLPTKQICVLTNLNRKFIEKWRRYIIVLVLILSNENYVYLKSYLNIKVGDNNEI